MCGVVIAMWLKVCDVICMEYECHNKGGCRGDGIPAAWCMAYCQSRDVVFCSDLSLNGCTNGFENGGLDFCEGDAIMTH